MKKFKLIIPVLVAMLAVTTAFTTTPKHLLSDKVWFAVDANGDEIDANNGHRGESSPFGCTTGPVSCARALSVMAAEVSLNTGSSTVYHINSGVDIQTDYDAAEFKP